MTISLPAPSRTARSLTEVLPSVMDALEGGSDWLAPARSAVVFVIDGLGAHNLASRPAHARFLTSIRRKRHVARTVFPSTTAAALTSLLTGTDPGRHGVVGYRVRVPDTGAVVNQLKGWDRGRLDPLRWQRVQPVSERVADAGRRFFVVSRGQFAHSGFTKATLRGAQQISEDDVRERARLAAHLAGEHPGSVVYVYTPDLDAAAHAHGWQSPQWEQALEEIDAAVRILADGLAPSTGALITADHGIVDVPARRHILLGEGDDLLGGVEAIGGEPRMLHLYAAPARVDDVLARWRESEGRRSWVLSRDEAIDAGVFGPVDGDVRDRIGEVLVAARAGIAYYDDRVEDKASQRMVGQHGSLTEQESVVPLLRLGAFA